MRSKPCDAWAASRGNFWPIAGVFTLNAGIVIGLGFLFMGVLWVVNSLIPQATPYVALVIGSALQLFCTMFNAGIFTQSLLEDMSVADWDRVLAVNLRGTFLVTRVLIGPMLGRGWGRVINIASQLGQIGGAEAVHYSASKGAVIAFTKALAREVAGRGVLVNAIAPGPIQTPLLDGETQAWRAAKLAELPIGRFGEVSEVVPTAVLLASDDGSYYVGQTLGPNGGDVML